MRFALLFAVSLVFTAVALAGNPPDPVETHAVATGSGPCGTAVAQGGRVAVDQRAAWVTRDRAGELVRVDLSTGRRQTIEVGASPWDVTLAFGAIWVTSAR
ncbi:MAG: hypothetical protein A2Y55_08680 [Actinobacteria bacterium RBG_16_68_12]|nr:MAG: hypothetical protein A2Y55_08680 [Actinobacteria bacterium RBG_16_68_12]